MTDFNFKPLHEDYLLLLRMNAPLPTKCKMLDHIIALWPGHWRVLGITTKALEVFEANDFKKSSGLDINRSHVTDRIVRNTFLLENPILDAQAWWDYIVDNDGTYFATKSENMSDNWSEVIEFNDAPDGAFQNAGFGWKHRKAVEVPFLKELHSTVSNA